MSRRTLILGFFLVLFVLHQDFWWRDDSRLVFGILPVSLAYQVFWTLLVAVGWFLVARFCWPHALEEKAATSGTTTNPSIGTSDPASRIVGGHNGFSGSASGLAGETRVSAGQTEHT